MRTLMSLLAAAAICGFCLADGELKPKLKATIKDSTAEIRHLAFSPDGKILVWVSETRVLPYEGETMLWDLDKGKGTKLIDRSKATDDRIAFRRDGVLASGGVDGIRLWDLNKRKETLSIKTKVGSNLLFNPDGKLILSGAITEELVITDCLHVWNADSGKLKTSLKSGRIGGVMCAEFKADGSHLAVSVLAMEPVVVLWDLSKEEKVRTFKEDQVITTIAYSPDGKLLVGGTEKGRVRIRDMTTGRLKRSIQGHANWVNAIRFCPDGKSFASASADGTVRIWDSESGNELAVLKDHKGKVNALAFSPDGRILATGGDDKLILLWEHPSGVKKDK